MQQPCCCYAAAIRIVIDFNIGRNNIRFINNENNNIDIIFTDNIGSNIIRINNIDINIITNNINIIGCNIINFNINNIGIINTNRINTTATWPYGPGALAQLLRSWSWQLQSSCSGVITFGNAAATQQLYYLDQQ